MSVTPNLQMPLLDTNQAQKELSHNEAIIILDAVLGGVIDRDLNDPPASPIEGDAYLIANESEAPTGVWVGYQDHLAYYLESAWYFIDPEFITGVIIYVQDEDVYVRWTGSSTGEYETLNIGNNVPAEVTTQSGTTYSIAALDEGKYIRFTNSSAKTVTVRDEETEELPVNGEWHIRNVGAGDLTIESDSDVTINVPYLGTQILLQGMTVTLKRVAVNEFDLFGQTDEGS